MDECDVGCFFFAFFSLLGWGALEMAGSFTPYYFPPRNLLGFLL